MKDESKFNRLVAQVGEEGAYIASPREVSGVLADLSFYGGLVEELAAQIPGRAVVAVNNGKLTMIETAEC